MLKKKKPVKPNAIDLMKLGLNGLVTVSATSIVDNLVGYFLPKKMRFATKIGVGVASYIASSALSEGVFSFVNKKLDEGFLADNPESAENITEETDEKALTIHFPGKTITL